MWNTISIVILVVEILMLTGFAVGKFRRKKLNQTVVFLAVVFAINLSLHLIPYLYGVVELGERGTVVLDLLACFRNAMEMFLGGIDEGAASDFAKNVPMYAYAYVLGALLAALATVSAAVEAFSNKLRNSFRLARALKKPSCDLVVGSGEMALRYAKNSENAVLVLDDAVSKERAAELMEADYVVLRKSFSADLLRSKYLYPQTRYNLICPDEKDVCFKYLDTFIGYWTAEKAPKDVHLYIEVDEDKIETIHREIIEKSVCGERITTFCSDELLARTFTERHPVTEHLPGDFLEEDGAVQPDVRINSFFLGFVPLSREIYRQSVLNNQLVKFEDGEYKVFPLRYQIFGADAGEDAWETVGLRETLQELTGEAERYFPLPELPFETDVVHEAPDSRRTLERLVRMIRQERSFSTVIVDTGDVYRNIDMGTRLRSMLDGAENFHIFIRSDSKYSRDEEKITYYGDYSKVFTHDVIVNDSLSAMAQKLNEVYTARQMKDQVDSPDFDRRVREQARESWHGMNCFTRNSNICCAVNLRLKLNLLGLDYTCDGTGGNSELIDRKYDREDRQYAYAEYFGRSKRNAMLAQEHARWNAYHLLAEYLPLEKSGITVKSADGRTVRFNTKNIPARKHACLTTFRGLDAMSSWLAGRAEEITGIPHGAEEYDVYIYDEMLITAASQLMEKLGYSVYEK